MQEINRLTPSYGGITYTRIENCGLQWLCPNEEHPGTPYLHKGGFSRVNDKGLFAQLTYRPSAEQTDTEFPLILSTDRSLYYYHSITMMRRVLGLEALDGNEWLSLHPEDAQRYGMEDGNWVKVTSRRGIAKTRAQVTDVCRQGKCCLTFNFHESPTNNITKPALDPIAKLLETKVSTVNIRPASA